jgi:hypothetical protein
MTRSISAATTIFRSKNGRFSDIVNPTPGVGCYNWEVVRQKVKSLKFTGNTTSAKPDERSFQ